MCGSASGSVIWIRIQILKAPKYGSNTDPDLQHCCWLITYPSLVACASSPPRAGPGWTSQSGRSRSGPKHTWTEQQYSIALQGCRKSRSRSKSRCRCRSRSRNLPGAGNVKNERLRQPCCNVQQTVGSYTSSDATQYQTLVYNTILSLHSFSA